MASAKLVKSDYTLLKQTFEDLGFEIIHFNGMPQRNGVDMWVKKKGRRPMSVEIKKLRRNTNRSYQVDPVLPLRLNDDLIAIILNDSYVLVEPMKDHLKACSPKGTRQFTILYGKEGE
jgi:hypothetical protein